MTIETPCVGLCALDPCRGICAGCGRTGEEIAGWLAYTATERRSIMARLAGRLAWPDRAGLVEGR